MSARRSRPVAERVAPAEQEDLRTRVVQVLAELDAVTDEARSDPITRVFLEHGITGLTTDVETAAKILGVSRAAAYRAANRFRETHGEEGLPIRLIGERRMLVSVPALRVLLETGVPPRPA
jgi:hypothetical protein